jgi:predicted MPP superfamily phosphohydrolase
VKRQHDVLKKFFLFLILVIPLSFLVYAFWIEPRQLIVKEVTIALPKLTHPVKAVVIGDIQPIRQHWPKERLNQAIDLAAKQKPDIVFYVGDYAYEQRWAQRYGIQDWFSVDPADIVKAMARINAPMGVYAVMGNHDYWWNGEAVKKMIRATHIQLLLNEARLAQTGRQTLWVAGLDDLVSGQPYSLKQALSKTNDTTPIVLLSHSPDIFPSVPASVALTLAGHTHGGQVYIPGIGRPIVPVRYKKYAMGLFKENGRQLFVTSGIGTAIVPIRFLTPPEIVVLNLVPAH